MEQNRDLIVAGNGAFDHLRSNGGDRTTRHRFGALAVTLAAVVFGIGTPAAADSPTSARPDFMVGVITPDSDESFEISRRGEDLLVTAPPTNQGGNLRVAVVEDRAPVSVDQAACVTWEGPDKDIVQPGIVLRSRIGRDGHTQAIMITNNVMWANRTAWNIHVADSAQVPIHSRIGSEELPDSSGTVFAPTAWPWRICGRAIGTSVEMKAWSIVDTPEEPAWGDPRFGYRVEVSPDWVFAGRPGVFIGHVKADQSARLVDLMVEDLSTTVGGSFWRRPMALVRRLLAVQVGIYP